MWVNILKHVLNCLQSGEELMLIPQEEASPAVTLKMSTDAVVPGNLENVAPTQAASENVMPPVNVQN